MLLRPAQPGRRRPGRCCRGRALWLPPLLRPSSPRKELLGIELEGAGGIPGGARASGGGQPAALEECGGMEECGAMGELNDAAAQAAGAAAQAAAVQPAMQPAATTETAAVSLP